MKCPVLMYNYLPNESPTEGIHCECLKEECAWWDEEREWCNDKTKTRMLVQIAEVLTTMMNKMPHEGQFSK